MIVDLFDVVVLDLARAHLEKLRQDLAGAKNTAALMRAFPDQAALFENAATEAKVQVELWEGRVKELDEAITERGKYW